MARADKKDACHRHERGVNCQNRHHPAPGRLHARARNRWIIAGAPFVIASDPDSRLVKPRRGKLRTVEQLLVTPANDIRGISR
jgi:hypothetical protein